jgi:hypothetical protein
LLDLILDQGMLWMLELVGIHQPENGNVAIVMLMGMWLELHDNDVLLGFKKSQDCVLQRLCRCSVAKVHETLLFYPLNMSFLRK